MTQKKCVAMLLAGGEGKRLAPLTQKLAKPAVPFGGQYRIIDFPLSNCVNSGIQTIGVLTQYKAESLHSHINDGRFWTGDKDTEISLLEADEFGGGLYTGTADAIYKNLEYIEEQNPEHVLILSGDHVYQMDYNAMLKFHEESGAEATISVKRVPWKDAHQFGIMNVDKSYKITDFVEKPENPESNLASMGIYMFRWSYLRRYLLADAVNAKSSHDFGKDVIPKMLADKTSVYAYPFQGYWRDVGTIESLWEAHMEVLDGEISLNAKHWPMYSSDKLKAEADAVTQVTEFDDTLIHPGSMVEGMVSRSVIFGGVHIGEGCEIHESIIMPNVKIGNDVTIYRAIIGEGSVIEDGAVVGRPNGEISVIAIEDYVPAGTSSESEIIPA
ncbi:glucose-1-phosphate adenylyltransferase [Paenibacillus vietnamensis]|uniref:glucose-1-phosphate adenylyltransferase n=1 Tax=Paenibacillus vietnamensis TaxID=2590547 RepID=UPI001CD120B6|nr:glucose-1-phosphate adenylyltransferase [Paenibacillus vietnamensis]